MPFSVVDRTGPRWTAGWLPVILALFLLTASALPALAGGPDQQLLAQAQTLYEKRADLATAERATALYRQVLQADCGDLSSSLKLCELLVWIGAQSEGKTEEDYYREVIAVAGQARRLHPMDPGPVYWLGVGQGMLATVASIGEALKMVKLARANMRLLLSMDPTYYHGGADRVLGRIYSKLPFFIGGDNQKAELHYKQAIDRGPHFWLNHLYLAELYHHEGRDAKAKQLLQQIAAGPAIHGLEPECHLWQKVARKYLVHGESLD